MDVFTSITVQACLPPSFFESIRGQELAVTAVTVSLRQESLEAPATRQYSLRRPLKKCHRISNAHAARLHPGLLRSSRAYCTNTRAPVLGGPGAFGPPDRPISRRHSSTAS